MGRPKSENKLVPVMVRLSVAEVDRIDVRRGSQSRSDYVRTMLFPYPLGIEKAPKRHADDCSCLSCEEDQARKEAKG